MRSDTRTLATLTSLLARALGSTAAQDGISKVEGRMAMGRAEQSRVIEALSPFLHRCVRSAGAKLSMYNTGVLDDIQQQLCLIVLEKWSDYRSEGSLEGWIYRIAFNLVRGLLRSEDHSPILLTLNGAVSEDDLHTLSQLEHIG